jgi:transposase-like protein
MNIKCPHCQNTTAQVKAGKTRTGSQRYKCNPCKRLYTPEPKQQGYPDEMRQNAVRMYVDGQNFRQIARQLGVDHKSIMNWINAHAAQQAKAPVPQDVNNAEMDELFTFVRAKKHRLRNDTGG